MTAFPVLSRLVLMLGLLVAPVLAVGPAFAAKPTEEEIQARIDAQVAKENAARAAPMATPDPTPASPPPPTLPSAPAAPVPARIYKTVPVILTTSLGPITIDVEVERAPITAGNFLKYVDQKRLDGTQFYRAYTFPDFPGVGLIQGGTQNDPKRVLKPVQHEPTSKTGLTHDNGAVSLARNELNSGTADFFVILGDMKGLDAGSGQNGPDDQGFAVFGHVTQGMDIVKAISVAPRSPTRGEGVMKGQMLEPPVKILTARRVDPVTP